MSNNSCNNEKLSDRLIASAEESLKSLYKMDFVNKLLLTGRMTVHNREIAHIANQRIKYLLVAYLELFRNGLLLSPTPEEKVFFETAIKLWSNYSDDEIIKTFGPIFDEVLAYPIPEITAINSEFLVNESKSNSMLRLFCALLPGYISLKSSYDYVSKQKDYKPNPFAELLTAHSFGIALAIDMIKNMIDKRAPVSEKEEKELIEVFKKGTELDLGYYYNYPDSD